MGEQEDKQRRIDKSEDGFDVDRLLKDLYKPPVFDNKDSLNELFERRIRELNISRTNALDILGIERLTLNGILGGTQKRVDSTNLKAIANFLQISIERVFKLYMEALEINYPEKAVISSDKIAFINENFDLAGLKKAKFLDSITDYVEIERRVINFFGLKDIFDYKKPPVDVAFSTGLVKPKNEYLRSFWIKAAEDAFSEINNPYEYDRQALIEYFPQIRWHSTSVEMGLLSIIRDLFKIGVTVFYQPSMPSLHLRGATFAVNEKPCVVLTNYVGFYPTLWFGLIHELYHVIFDWKEIKSNRYKYHLSDDETETLSVKERENQADNFAREYLLPKEKSYAIRQHLNNESYVNQFAKDNHVHPSFIYVFNAYDEGNKNRTAWARARKHNPNTDKLIEKLTNPWDVQQPVREFIKSIKYNLYR